ncbi:hypothetical protein EKK58_08090 [Candidatus Dependentiae bacterium]|nr:MAG: hypothetical protein EKK58_08090 [Candidatus Dependentiae bacterium]
MDCWWTGDAMAPIDQPQGILISRTGRNLHLQYNNNYVYINSFKEVEFTEGGYVTDSHLIRAWFLIAPFSLVKWDREDV